MSHLAEHFSEYFSLQFADTEALQQEAFKIRYRVYCEEFQYRSKENCPEGLEKDVDDDRSLHFLLQHNSSKSSIGCVRLVLPNQKFNNILPFERSVPKEVEMSWQPCLRHNYGEISRLAVIPEFRRRQGEDTNPIGELLSANDLRNSHYNFLEQRKFSLIALSLYLTPIAISLELGIDLIAVMKPRLARNLRSIGIVSHCLSNLFDYQGKQGLFLIKPQEILQYADSNIQDLLACIHDRVFKSISDDRWQELHRDLCPASNSISPKLPLAS
jgi:N-acyl amino acid synthase of PEP-CTERM/exosortase system